MKYGVRFFDSDGKEWRLVQIARGPQLTISCEGRLYSTIPPFGLPGGVKWEPYEAREGRLNETEGAARKTCDALSQAAAGCGEEIG